VPHRSARQHGAKPASSNARSAAPLKGLVLVNKQPKAVPVRLNLNTGVSFRSMRDGYPFCPRRPNSDGSMMRGYACTFRRFLQRPHDGVPWRDGPRKRRLAHHPGRSHRKSCDGFSSKLRGGSRRSLSLARLGIGIGQTRVSPQFREHVDGASVGHYPDRIVLTMATVEVKDTLDEQKP
jgi:hypothetical protein